MKNLLCLFFLCLTIQPIFAQKDYFQQQVDYKIEVTLNDQTHELTGNIEMVYTNNAPDALNEIYLHLWPNAYQNRNTAFARQKIRQGDTEFYFAKDQQKGGFSNLNFTIDGKLVELEQDKKNPDIAILRLSKPLASSDKLTIATPFTLKIPASFSRLGHVKESYQMTQWYPKPAVYDADGWHPMPYLDMGEFYSEFGSFDVSITLPENYVVAATGELQTASEKVFLENQVKRSTEQLKQLQPDAPLVVDTFPTSSPNTKTLRYTANQVHDFAWFADKRFYVQKSAVTLATGKTVDTWAFFTNTEADLWKEATTYLDRSTKFYSELVGAYPYSDATAVQSALSAGGGMEYPMITVIGLSRTAQALDEVITHEVGHNWFYGILGFNERDHAWMDEGINSYYDHRYSRQYYTDTRFLEGENVSWFFRDSPIDLLELGYLHQARPHEDQAPETTSDDFMYINYWLGAYEKPAVSLRWLEQYLGVEKFDQYFQKFYEDWKFRHPQPADLRAHLEGVTQKDLSWLFDGLINSTKQVDYAIKNIEKKRGDYKLTIQNKGAIKAPFPITGMKEGKKVTSIFVEGFDNEKKIDFPDGDYDKIVIDAEGITTDINRRNNYYKTSGAFKAIEPLSLKFLTNVENPTKTTLYYAPIGGYNKYDGVSAGLALYNIAVPEKPFEFALMPSYGFKSKQLIGMGELAYRFYPDADFIKGVKIGLGVKQFNFQYNEVNDYHLTYRKITPSITLKLNSQPNKRFDHYLKFRTLVLSEESAIFATDTMTMQTRYAGNTTSTRPIFELSYEAENRRGINPYRLKVALEQQSYSSFFGDQNYLKASIDYTTNYTYKPGRNVTFRFFVGGFLTNTLRDRGAGRNTEGSLALYSEGFNDYKYDELFFGRSEVDGAFSQQISLNDGGMKLPVGATQAGNLGKSNNFIFAINLKSDLPQRLPLDLPIKPYFDIGYFDNTSPLGSDDQFGDQLVYSGGIMLDFFDGLFGVYFPLLNSDNVKTLLDQRGGFGNRISFSVDFKRLHPARMRERATF